MKQADFELLIRNAGLNLCGTCGYHFAVSLHVQREFGVRHQCGLLAYDPAEFAMLTPERARQQIEAKRKSLEQAAYTQQGIEADEIAQHVQAKPMQKKQDTPRVAVNYPAH